MELDDAEEAEVVSATVADLVDAITAREIGTGRSRETDVHDDQPRTGGSAAARSAGWWSPRR